MKSTMILVFAALIAGCTPSYESLDYPVTPNELKDCKFFSLTSSSGSNLKVVRCPNSQTSTTYMQGKVQETVVVIDGVEYIKKEK